MKPTYEQLLAALKDFVAAEARYAKAERLFGEARETERRAAVVEISTAMGISELLIQAAEA